MVRCCLFRGEVVVVVRCSCGDAFSLSSAATFIGFGLRFSTSNRRRCPCFVVGFRLPLVLCLRGRLFLGEAVWRVSFSGGDGEEW